MISAMERQTCKCCGRPDKFDFYVPDELWEQIVPADLRNRVVCLYCFDDFAAEAGINYADHLHCLYFAGDQATFIFQTAKAVTG